MRICHIITGLNIGGAEMVLYRLLLGLDKEKYKVSVVSLTELGPVGEKIQNLGINVKALNMRYRVSDLKALIQLIVYLKRSRFDLVQTWMYHANLIGGIAAKLAGGIPVIWGLHHSDTSVGFVKKTTLSVVKAGALLSGWVPEVIVCCSRETRRIHLKYRYRSDKMVVIFNGYDLVEFKPDLSARAKLLQELKLSKEALLIGLVARFHPQKDQRGFIEAAEGLSKKVPAVYFILIGPRVTESNKQLFQWVVEKGLQQRVYLLGERNDLPQILSGLDIVTLSSSCGEGFPNVLGEAMACGTPCVTTDVGDSAFVVGETGLVVPPKNPKALTEAWQQLIELGSEGRRKLGTAARQRIKDNFPLSRNLEQYERLYERLGPS
ncbi:MAG: glycosyltransferase [Candidatus Omnitrophica bacterium]|nr:glycosyltransferase [Candidatus Omnitrophota bacterium]